MAVAQEGGPRRPSGHLLNGGWILACVFVAFFGVDFAERHVHRPLCVEACGTAGEAVIEASHGPSGRAGLFDNSLRCACSGGRQVRLYLPWRECFNWFAGQIVATVALAGMVALARRSSTRA